MSFNSVKSSRQNGLRLGFVAAALIMSACGSAGTPSTGTNKNATATPYVIHAIVSETGAGAFLGSREAKSLQALARYVNAHGGIDGHPVEMSIQNNESSPSTAVSLASPLVSSGVPFILNGSLTATDKAVNALAGSTGPFMFGLSPGVSPSPGSMIFSAGDATVLQIEAALNFLKSKGLTNIASVTSTDASGADGYKQLTAALALPRYSTFHLLTHQTFDPAAVNVSTELSVVKAMHPQAMLVWTTGTPFGTVLNGMSSLGMENIPTVTTNANAVYSELVHFESLLPKELYFPSGTIYLSPSNINNSAVRAQVTSFDAAINTAGGHVGDAWGLAWDPAQLLIAAIKKLGIHATAKQILHYMQNLHNTPGIYGLYNTSKTNHRGTSISSIYMTSFTGKGFRAESGPGGTPTKK